MMCLELYCCKVIELYLNFGFRILSLGFCGLFCIWYYVVFVGYIFSNTLFERSCVYRGIFLYF